MYFTVIVKKRTRFNCWLADVDALQKPQIIWQNTLGVGALGMGVWLAIAPAVPFLAVFAWPLLAMGVVLTVVNCATWVCRPVARQAIKRHELVRVDEAVMTMFLGYLQALGKAKNFAEVRSWAIKNRAERLALLSSQMKLLDSPHGYTYASQILEGMHKLFDEFIAASEQS